MIRPSDILFYGGGECFQKFGVPFLGFTRDQRVAPSFTRSGAVGPFTDRNGKLRSASANRLRTEWLDTDGDLVFDTPALLVEAARTNLVGSDDFSAWTSVGTPVVTGSISDPAGGTNAYRIDDDDAGNEEYKYRAVTFTGDGIKSAVFVVREATQPAGGNQDLRIGDTTAAVYRLRLQISAWVGGKPTVSAAIGTYLGQRYVGNGFWAIYGQTTSVTAANAHTAEISPAGSGGATTGSIDIYRVNTYDADIPSRSILNASEVRNADLWVSPWLRKPQAMTVYVKMIESGTARSAGYVMHIGANSGADPYFSIYGDAATGYYSAVHSPAAASTSTVSTAPAFGDVVELLVQIDADGAVLMTQVLDSGAEVAGSQGTDQAFAATWSDDILNIGGTGLTTQGMNPIIVVKIARDVRTMADMRDLFAWVAL